MPKSSARLFVLLTIFLMLLGTGCATAPAPQTAPQAPATDTPTAEPAVPVRPAPRGPSDPSEPGEANEVPWVDSLTYTADGPGFVDLRTVEPGGFSKYTHLTRGRKGERIESPISEERAAILRQLAMLQEPNPGVQNIADATQRVASRAPTAGVAFDSIDFTQCCGGGGSVPPDPELAVGPNHIIAVVNVAFEIYDKSGNVLQPATSFASFFAAHPDCDAPPNGVFDPNAIYDEEEDRFILGIDGNFTDYCIAASVGPDPVNSGWHTYNFMTNFGGADFDYPHAGVGLDAIYMGSNQFGGAAGFEGRVFAIDKAALYAGSPTLTVVTHSTGFDGTPQPANLHGFAQGTWPTSGPHYIMTEVFDGPTHTVWSWTDPFGANIFNRDGDVDLAAAAGSPCPGQSCFPVDVPQLGGLPIQANDFRGLDTEYRNGFLWTNQTISCNPGGGTVDCVRWAQVDPTGPSVVQAGVFASPGEWRFFPDLAVNHCDDMSVGYTKSSPTTFPGVWVTGRESTDPPGVLQAETLLKAGELTYTSFETSQPPFTAYRWGDYTGMTIDPDGQTFWYLGEYAKDNGNTVGNPDTHWGTYIGSFSYPNCQVNTCGNGTIEAPEVCDPPDFGGETCVTQGFDGGVLGCATDCGSFDTSACVLCDEGRTHGEWKLPQGAVSGFASGKLVDLNNVGVYGLRARLVATSATTGRIIGQLGDGTIPDPDFDVRGTYTITNPPGAGRWQAEIFQLGTTTNPVGKMEGGFDTNPTGTTLGRYKGEWKLCN